jgi:exodeoxyribonuclease-5
MLSSFIEQKIISHLNLEPTEQQKELIFELAKFISEEEKDIFILKGYAGTGKTTIISAIVNALSEFNIESILLAPTGRAAKVFSSTALRPAYTIHKKIYRAKNAKSYISKFVLDINKHKNTIFIVDESSMISNNSDNKSMFGSGKLLDDLIKYVFSGTNCKIIFAGDTAQLPPVGSQFSPALDYNSLNIYGKKITEFEISQVVRQSLKSGILYNATILRQMISQNTYAKYPKFKTNGFNDFVKITGTELIETISDSYASVGQDNTIVITRSNKRANLYNQGIRQSILYRENEFSTEDLVMIVKNNYYWKDFDQSIDFIANGDLAHISNIKSYENLYDLHFADAELYFPDYDIFINAKVLLDTLSSDTPSLTQEQFKTFYEKVSESYDDIKINKKKYEKIKMDKHLNALQLKFAYAVTCHKAQGGQWDNVFVDQAYITENMLNIDYYRWLYTALTRASNKIFLVNFKNDFFDN